MVEDAIRAAVKAALAAELPGALAEAFEAATAARGLATREETARHLAISTRSLDTLRAQGLPTVWVIDSPRFDLVEVLGWLRGRK